MTSACNGRLAVRGFHVNISSQTLRVRLPDYPRRNYKDYPLFHNPSLVLGKLSSAGDLTKTY